MDKIGQAPAVKPKVTTGFSQRANQAGCGDYPILKKG